MALQLLDVDKFLQNAKTVTNARLFTNTMDPAPGGLQDPAIFGVSTNEKFNTWGVINLEDVIMHPLVYDNLNIIDPIFKRVLLKKNKVNIVDGMLRETDNGGTGLNWLITNWDKINLDKGSLAKANLVGASFKGANLHAVDFLRSTITDTDFFGSNLDNTLIKNWRPE